MPRKPDPRRLKVIRRGDRVRIVTPDFFVRCGYPKSVGTEAEVVREKFGAIIKGMIYNPDKSPVPFSLDPYPDQRLLEKVFREVAYARLKVNGFGGGKRSIHTKRMEELSGKEFVVVDVSFCKTGSYSPPGMSGGSYEYEPEFEPGVLLDEKTHKILSLAARSLQDEVGTGLRIDAANVEKVMPPDEPS